MRSRKATHDDVAEMARRRLELVAAELAQVSRTPPSGPPEDPPSPADLPEDPASPSDLPEDLPSHETSPITTSGDPTVAAPTSGPAATQAGRHARRSVGFSVRSLGWVHDRLPPTMQGRVQLGASHLAVVALLVAASLVMTAWWVMRADGGGTVVPAALPTPAGLPSLPITAEAASAAPRDEAQPSGSRPPSIVIDVAGKVRRPGIATLPAGSRVVDALKAAGGARRGADLMDLNLARPLVDGEQIVVGVPPPHGVAAPAASAPGVPGSGTPGPLVNLNSATQAELETLPGVGPVTAAAILAWRTEHGAFTAVDELLEISGIGDATIF